MILQKTYSCETSTAVFRGCYVFASEESLRALRQGELARTTRADYQVDEIRVEGYEVFLPLYMEAQLTTQQAQRNYMTNY